MGVWVPTELQKELLQDAQAVRTTLAHPSTIRSLENRGLIRVGQISGIPYLTDAGRYALETHPALTELTKES